MSSGSAGIAGNLASGLYQATPPTLTDGQQSALRLDSTGALVTTGAGSGGAEPVNLTQVGGTAVNAGAAAAGFVPTTQFDSHGTQIDYTLPTPTQGYGTVVSGASGWTVPAAGFSNPQYIAASVNDSTGIDIRNYVVIYSYFSGTYSGQTVLHELTNDISGAGGWWQTRANDTIAASAVATNLDGPPVSNGSSAFRTYKIKVEGVRYRMRVTALSGTSINATVSLATTALVDQVTPMGPVAHDSPIVGNPNRIGARARTPGTPYNAVAADDTTDLVTDLLGALLVAPQYTNSNITTASTTTVKSGAGILHTITVNSKGTVASTVVAYDNTAGSGTKLATIDSLTLSGTFGPYDATFGTGLTIVTTGSAAPDISVTYR